MARKTTAKSSKRSSSSSQRRARTTRGRRTPDALAMLREDHAAVSKLFADYDRRKKRLSGDQKRDLAEEICLELKVHAELEEELFYPALRESVGSGPNANLLDEAEVEHASAKDLIQQIEQEGPETEFYDAKVKVLGEYVKHHIKEEQGKIFQLARKAKLDLKALGEQLAESKQRLKSQMTSETRSEF